MTIITTLFENDMPAAKQIMNIVADIKRNPEEIAWGCIACGETTYCGTIPLIDGFTSQVCAVSSVNIDGLAVSKGRSMTARLKLQGVCSIIVKTRR